MTPQEVTEKMKAWRLWQAVWNWTHYILGFGSAMLAVIVAANTKNQLLLDDRWSVIIAAVAAGLAFLNTGLGAGARANSFETAARELEKALALYQPGTPDTSLREAIVRGIDMLNKH